AEPKSWDLVIGDELHFLKNPKAARTKAVFSIRKRAKKFIGLTGTPIPNKVVEMWPVLQLVAPKVWDPAGTRKVKGEDGKKEWKALEAGEGAGFFKFAKRFCGAHEIMVGRNKTVWTFDGSSNLPELQDK